MNRTEREYASAISATSIPGRVISAQNAPLLFRRTAISRATWPEVPASPLPRPQERHGQRPREMADADRGAVVDVAHAK